MPRYFPSEFFSRCTDGILTQSEPQDLEADLALQCKKWNILFYVCLTFHSDIWIMSVMSKKYFYKLLLQLWIRFLRLHFFVIDIDIKEEGRKFKKLFELYEIKMYKDIFKKTWKVWFWSKSLVFNYLVNNPGNSFSYLPPKMSFFADRTLRYFKWVICA